MAKSNKVMNSDKQWSSRKPYRVMKDEKMNNYIEPAIFEN